MRELTEADFEHAMPRQQRQRLIRGRFESGADVVALRLFIGLSPAVFAEALGVSVHTLRSWEHDRRRPDGPALALLRIAARHPRMIRENLVTAA
jgi:putative transcriptional regulator